MSALRIGRKVVLRAAMTKQLLMPVRNMSEQASLSKEYFEGLVNGSKVVVFMKGVPEEPRCGFSNAVVQILKMHGVTYDSYDVLSDNKLREGVKDFTKWPTIPQIFVDGVFIGGCDILVQMHQNGELVQELKKCGITSRLDSLSSK